MNVIVVDKPNIKPDTKNTDAKSTNNNDDTKKTTPIKNIGLWTGGFC